MQNDLILNSENDYYSVISDEKDIRLDVFISEKIGVTRSKASNLIEGGYVLVDSKNVKKNYKVQFADQLEIFLPENEECDICPENIPIDIVYEDKDLLVVNKPQGMVVHPAPGNYTGTLVNALMYHVHDLSGINGEIRPGIVHRIDKNTSGLLVVAKNDIAHVGLATQIKEHSFDRFYEAVVYGCPKDKTGDVRYSIGRSQTDRKMMAAYPEKCDLPGVRNAVTHYEVIEDFGKYSHLKLKLETGRTHQIRVHMNKIGHAVVGDDLYGSQKLEKFGLHGQCLHARQIGFIHPRTGEHLVFESELPDYFQSVLEKIRRIVK